MTTPVASPKRAAAAVVGGLLLAGVGWVAPAAGTTTSGAGASAVSPASAVGAPSLRRVPQARATVAAGLPGVSGPRGRLVVGDSLAVGVRTRLRARGYAVNAKVGRQFSTAPGILRGYGARLPRNVVVELGTNGTISLKDCRAVVRIAGKHRRVFLVTNRVPRSWERPNRRTVRACNRSFAGPRVRVINWYRHSAGHPGWFAADGVHPSSTGQRRLVGLIDGYLDRAALR